MALRVKVQCRVQDEAFKETALRRKDGKSVAKVGTVLDKKKMRPGDVDRLLKSGAIEDTENRR